jgi:hypothetical protein
MVHRKIIINNSVLGDVAFADYYRFGDSSGFVPMVHYTGGAISRETYLARLKLVPEPIVEEFALAWESSGSSAVDLLVSSAPPSGEARRHGVLQDFFSHILFEVLPSTDNPRPEITSFVGNSFGAHLASYLTFSLAGAAALSTVAGCGMADAARQTSLVNIQNKQIKVFSNLDDGTEDEDNDLKRFLMLHGNHTEIVRRPGTHDFDDYRKNGSLRDAFSFCLDVILSKRM